MRGKGSHVYNSPKKPTPEVRWGALENALALAIDDSLWETTPDGLAAVLMPIIREFFEETTP